MRVANGAAQAKGGYPRYRPNNPRNWKKPHKTHERQNRH
jgi:hypothetical protein